MHSCHASYRLLFSIFLSLTLSNAGCPWFLCFFSLFSSFVFPFQPLTSWLERLGQKITSTSSSLAFESDRFRFEKNQETYEKLNIFRSVWIECKVIKSRSIETIKSRSTETIKNRVFLFGLSRRLSKFSSRCGRRCSGLSHGCLPKEVS